MYMYVLLCSHIRLTEIGSNLVLQVKFSTQGNKSKLFNNKTIKCKTKNSRCLGLINIRNNNYA